MLGGSEGRRRGSERERGREREGKGKKGEPSASASSDALFWSRLRVRGVWWLLAAVAVCGLAALPAPHGLARRTPTTQSCRVRRRAIEQAKAQMAVIAMDCDQPDYIKLVKSLCAEKSVDVVRLFA